MKIGQKVGSYRLTNVVAQFGKPSVQFATGTNPGNKRPSFAVFSVERVLGHEIATPVAVYSAHDLTAEQRERLAVSDMLRRSGLAAVLLDSLALA